MSGTVYALFTQSNQNQIESLATKMKILYNWIGEIRPWGNIARNARKSSARESFFLERTEKKQYTYIKEEKEARDNISDSVRTYSCARPIVL